MNTDSDVLQDSSLVRPALRKHKQAQSPQTTSGLRPCKLKIVQSLNELSADWNKLLALTPNGSIFMCWEWASTWWKTYSTERDNLLVVLIYQDDTLVGLAPLYERKLPLSLKRELRLIGTGEPERCEVVSEDLDLLVLPGAEEQVLKLVTAFISNWLQQNGPMSEFTCGGMTTNHLLSEVSSRLTTAFSYFESYDHLRFSWRLNSNQPLEYVATRKKRILRSKRSLDKEGGLQRVPSNSVVQVIENYEILKTLHESRWTTKGSKGAFASKEFNHFHLQLLKKLFPLNQANIVLYKLGTKTIAALYCFNYSGTTTYYQSGFSPESSNRYMPLTHAHYTEAEHSRSHLGHSYTFLRGTKDSYKSGFGCDTEPLQDITVFGSYLCYLTYRTKRTIRQFARRIVRRSLSVIQ